MNISEQLVKDFDLKTFQVQNTLALFDEGATVPFISRYRKEATGSLDEIQVRDLEHKYEYYKELDDRRATILDSIRSQEKLTPELEKKINATLSKTELEDLYLPYKPKRITRGKKARDAGLEPLARWIHDLEAPEADIIAEASKYINAEAGFDTPEKALGGACDILAEELSDNADIRKWFREMAMEEGEMISKVKKDFEEKKTKFEMYYDYKEPVKAIPSHRFLAMLRGEKEKVLRLELAFPREKAIAYLESKLIAHVGSAAEPTLKRVVEDTLDRFLSIATETEIRNEVRARAEDVAFDVFGKNLRELLMSPPAGRKPVIGLDPGFRTGCKMVALDNTGKYLEYATIFPNQPQNKIDEARAVLLAFIQKYGIKLIAIGNGTASRETESFVRESIADIPAEHQPICVVVNESGASVYSASEVAIKEFPDFDLTVRGAVSIARRLQDPLSELVKIDPKSIGVGQYQHDVNQSKLKKALEEVVESCVNTVGVDINLASEELLKYVSGLTRTHAKNIVKFRNEKGAFHSRDILTDVSGIGPKAFEQSAGFLRIPGADNPLDNSSVHPERYDFVTSMASALSTSIHSLIGNKQALAQVDKKLFVTDDIGLPTIDDILAELEKPGRDPREEFKYAKFDENITKLSDLTEGMALEGTVTNVTNFGAFVDIGVHQDGLVHISELADRFVKDPNDIVKVGQVVKVRVLSVDSHLKRIALSMKSPDASGPKPESGDNQRQKDPGKQRPDRRGPRQPKRPATISDLGSQWGAKVKKGKGDDDKLKTVKPKISKKSLGL